MTMKMRQPNDVDVRQHAVTHLRETAAARVENTSLRDVAREIGMSPTGLKKFLHGASPYAATLRRLRSWYVQYAAVRQDSLGLEDAYTAVNVLGHDLTPEACRIMAARVAEAVAGGYTDSGKEVPNWLAELRARFETAGSISTSPGARPSAMGKYAHLKWSSEDYARRKHEEIDLEDGRAA